MQDGQVSASQPYFEAEDLPSFAIQKVNPLLSEDIC